MLIWKDTKQGVTFGLLEEINSETILRNYFPKPKLHRGNGGCFINMNRILYYERAKPSSFSALKKFQEDAKQSELGKKRNEINPWLQNAKCLHITYSAEK